MACSAKGAAHSDCLRTLAASRQSQTKRSVMNATKPRRLDRGFRLAGQRGRLSTNQPVAVAQRVVTFCILHAPDACESPAIQPQFSKPDASGGFMSAYQSGKFGFGLMLATALALPAAGAQAYTQDEQSACSPDAFRLCGPEIPDVDRITACMIRNKSQLSPACRVFFREPRRPRSQPAGRSPSSRRRRASRSAPSRARRRNRQSPPRPESKTSSVQKVARALLLASRAPRCVRTVLFASRRRCAKKSWPGPDARLGRLRRISAPCWDYTRCCAARCDSKTHPVD